MPRLAPAVWHWAAEECERQRSGEVSVAWMIDAWVYAHRRRSRPLNLRDVLSLAAIAEPRHNLDGVRTVDVHVGSDVKMPHDQVDGALHKLVSAYPFTDLELAGEWYRQYEEVHPFRDGNGRTGSILYNHLRRTLDTPERPPDFWGDPAEQSGWITSEQLLQLRRMQLREEGGQI
jgi:hypothetical protein